MDKKGSTKYTPVQKAEVLELRRSGVSLANIALKTGVNQGTIKAWAASEGIVLTPSQRSKNCESIPENVKNQVIALRQENKTIKEITSLTGQSKGSIKKILGKAQVVLPMEIRQSNAYKSKLEKNPNAMKKMRESLTPTVLETRKLSIQNAYRDQALKDLKGAQSKAWWSSQGSTSKYTWEDIKDVISKFKMSTLSTSTGIIEAQTTHVDIVCHCGLTFLSGVYDVLYGKVRSCGCVKSAPQAEITKGLQDRGFEVESNNRSILPSGKELDIWLPKQRIAVEYCGLVWHGEMISKTSVNARSRHFEKLAECESLGIRLITIFSDEYIQSPALVWGFLDSIVGLNSNKYGARQLSLKAVPVHEAQQFWKENHLQGPSPTPVCLGLYDGPVLVSAIGCRPRSEDRLGTPVLGYWELARYAVKPGVLIQGGFARLWKAFLKQEKPETVVSFSDLRWSYGDLYSRHGLIKETRLPPSYSYFKKNTEHQRFAKGNFKKELIQQKLGELLPDETEWEAMQRFGYDRIWDCGLDRWVWKPD